MTKRTAIAGALVGPALILCLGCASGGAPAPAPAPEATGPYTAEVSGEVERVDLSRNELWITRDDGRWERIGLSSAVRVFYRGEEYEPANLEPGDYVRVRVRGEGDRRTTDWIEVEESRQERRGEPAPLPPGETAPLPPTDRDSGPVATERLTGTVEWVDDREGRFGIDTGRGGRVAVTVPFNVGDEDRAIFRDLRRGDYVRVEVRRVGDDRLELVRFDGGR